MPDNAIPIRFRPASTKTLSWNHGLFAMESLLHPLSLVLPLWAVAYLFEGRLGAPYLVLSLPLFLLSLPTASQLQKPVWRFMRDRLPSWIAITLVVVWFVQFSDFTSFVNERALMMWAVIALPCQAGAHSLLRWLAPSFAQRLPRRAVIAGLNEDGLALAQQIYGSPYIGTRLIGFFDDRSPERAPTVGPYALQRLGTIQDLPEYTRQHRVEVVYLCLPMARQSRILRLLERLCDSTVSIYFVPTLQLSDLMHGRIDSVGDLSVVSVCETPFRGWNGVVKRASDIVLSILILAAIAPLLALIALAVRLESPGPVIFRQRRYGLGGEEITVSKFRTMKVCEDGADIRQATRNDDRFTRLGPFLRGTSLDELPQFFDVLRGRMSIVGPRPHAVAHNELYRKLITGYMIRHKVKPGITGWAQVNGCRGETESLEKMKLRIEYDLAYMRSWSLVLDLYIIMKTIIVVFRDRRAY